MTADPIRAPRGARRHEGAFLVPPSHAAFLARMRSPVNKDGVRRLALREVARHFDATSHEESFVFQATAEEEAAAWTWTLARTRLFADTREDVVAANRMASDRLAAVLMKRVYQLRNARRLAMLHAPRSERRQERLDRAHAAAQAKTRARLRPGPTPLSQTTRVASRMSRRQSAGAWHASLQHALRTRGRQAVPPTGLCASGKAAT